VATSKTAGQRGTTRVAKALVAAPAPVAAGAPTARTKRAATPTPIAKPAPAGRATRKTVATPPVLAKAPPAKAPPAKAPPAKAPPAKAPPAKLAGRKVAAAKVVPVPRTASKTAAPKRAPASTKAAAGKKPAAAKAARQPSKRAPTPALRLVKKKGGAKLRVPVVPVRAVKIRELDPLAKCGANTSVQHLYRVDELTDGRAAIHLVFFDRHGWYCVHGRACTAVEDVRKHARIRA
jgi:hypothetical protein